ncbi:MAG: creatininase family protein [Ginsengibacter sp.]
MIWDQHTSEQIAALDRNIPVLLPMAATEQHGPHLPLSTDRLIGEYFANQLNTLINDRVLILPAVSIGCSSHHLDFPGTLSIGHQTFSHQVHDIVNSVIHHGFQKIILFNSHGGNQGIGQVLTEQLGYQYPHAHFVMITWWRIALDALEKITETGLGGTGHACEFETSLMLLIAPHLVIKENIRPGENNPTFPWAEGDMLHGSKATYYRSMKEMTLNGVYGNPSAASIEKGIKITDAVMTPLKQIVIDLFNANNP